MITLEKIENVTFRKAGFSGYKIEDVDEFVDKVIEKVKALEHENRELSSRVETQDKDIVKFKEKEESVQNAIISAEMTAKKIVMEATMKSDEKLSESKEEAEKIVREAEEHAKRVRAEADAKAEELMNVALRESSAKIEENNEILEQQKKNIIRLMGEANKFRNSLIQSYKEHLKVINNMSKADDFKKQQKEMDENYKLMHGNGPMTLGSESAAKEESTEEESEASDAVTNSAEDREELTASAAPVEEDTTVSLVSSDSTEIKNNVQETVSDSDHKASEEELKSEEPEKEQEDNVVFFTGAQDSEKTVSDNNRQPIVFESSRPETVSGMLKVEDTAVPYNKKNKHKKRR